MDPDALKQYLADSPPTIVTLDIKPHFETLNKKEKLYAHYISLACFSGYRIVLRQVSEESEPIYDLIVSLYKECGGDWKSLAKRASLSDDDLQAFLDYAAQFLGNGGNYKSFGDSKFIPRLSPEKFKALAGCSKKTSDLYDKANGGIFAGSDSGHLHMGYPADGHVSTYYPHSPNITKQEITAVSEFLDNKGLLPENTRLRKMSDGNFEVLIASSDQNPSSKHRDVEPKEFDLDGELSGKKLKLIYGDHSAEMGKIAEAIGQAGSFASNETEAKMMHEYAESFQSGSQQAFKQSQRYWIQDKGPTVESDIGFIETYRDPQGIRGEWEGFVAMVNKEQTANFAKLVDSAPKQIPKLPWSSAFEKDKFLTPDFTSLEVMTFAGSGIPAGINIPNFDDIRQTEGFKNVSLGNVLNAKAPNEKITFIKDGDLELYKANRDPSFEVQVGLHELLGHGCGKLLQETSKGEYNFDIKNPPISPITNKPITTWYKPGQTWGSVFGSVGPSYEECRAECVAMYLGCEFDILALFGFGDGTEDLHGKAGDILYASYLSMARAGLLALEFWDPKSRKWGQIHMQARFSILQTFLQAGGGFASLDYKKDDLSDLTISIDRSKILSHGRPAVHQYLQKLGVYKATADVEAGSKLYNEATHVNEWYATKVRKQVLAQKLPRKVFVQANTVVKGDDTPVLKEYPATAEGMIQSFAERSYI